MQGVLRSSRRRAAWLLGAAIALNAIARGGVDVQTIGATLCILTLAVVLAIRGTVRRERSRGGEDKRLLVPVLPLVLALAGAWVALQLVPLPPAVLRLVSKGAESLFEDSLAPVGLWPAWRPVSLDPGETALQLGAAMTTIAACIGAALLADSRRRTDLLLAVLSLSGLAVSVIGLGAAALRVAPLLESGVTFVNPNNLAGFLQLAAWPALGFALRSRGRSRVAWLGVFAFTAAGIFLSLSRAGIVAFFVAGAVWVVLAARSGHAVFALRRRGDGEDAELSARAVVRATVVPVAVFAALGIASWLALGRIVSEMESVKHATSEIKVGMWPEALRLIGRFPLVGIGRGAFATLYPAWKSLPEQMTFTHLENSWLQIPLDLGLPLGLALIGVFAWAFIAAARSRELSRPFIGALAGAAGVAAQNVFDFSFDIPGVAIPLVVVLGIASRSMPAARVRPIVVHAIVAASLVLGAAGLSLHVRRRGDDAARSIAAAPTPELAIAAAQEGLRWHPADWVPHASVGVILVRAGRCAEAMPWLVRAMERNPTAPEPHRYAARCLAAAGQDESAKREYRLAYLYWDATALKEAYARYPEPGELLEIVPQTPDGLLAASYILADCPEEAREAYRRLWEEFLDKRGLAGLAQTTLKAGSPEEALQLARQLQQLEQLEPQGYVVASRALDDLGDPDSARAELELGAARLPGDPNVLAPLGYRELAARHPSQAKSIFDRIVARDAPTLSRKKLYLAHALEAQGRTPEALREAQDAVATDRSNIGALEAIARCSSAVGQFDVAIDALERASRLPSASAGRYEAALNELRARHAAQDLKRKLIQDGVR